MLKPLPYEVVVEATKYLHDDLREVYIGLRDEAQADGKNDEARQIQAMIDLMEDALPPVVEKSLLYDEGGWK